MKRGPANRGFNGRALVPDAVYGIRTFRTHGDRGQLWSPVANAAWSPGVNDAACRRDGLTIFSQVTGHGAGHEIASADCSCGFYAYFSQASNQYSGPGAIYAVVRATGLCTVGTLGFRASHAEIVALVRPAWASPRGALCRLVTWLYIALGGAGVAADHHGWLRWLLATGVTTALFVTLSNATDLFYKVRWWRRIRRAYPGAATYPTVERCLAAHPLSEPPAEPPLPSERAS